MEIDLQRFKDKKLLLPAVVLILLLLTGTLGAQVTPHSAAGEPRLLTWLEWQVRSSRRAYQAELGRMQRSADELANLFTASPDPVRVQLVTSRVLHSTRDGLPALAYARERLAEAAVALQKWSVGALPAQATRQELERARQALQVSHGGDSQ